MLPHRAAPQSLSAPPGRSGGCTRANDGRPVIAMGLQRGETSSHGQVDTGQRAGHRLWVEQQRIEGRCLTTASRLRMARRKRTFCGCSELSSPALTVSSAPSSQGIWPSSRVTSTPEAAGHFDQVPQQTEACDVSAGCARWSRRHCAPGRFD